MVQGVAYFRTPWGLDISKALKAWGVAYFRAPQGLALEV